VKANRVRVDKPLRLGIDAAGTPGHAGSCASDVPARVRITQSGSDFAVVEVTCSCGKVIQVRCEYAPADAAVAGGKPA